MAEFWGAFPSFKVRVWSPIQDVSLTFDVEERDRLTKTLQSTLRTDVQGVVYYRGHVLSHVEVRVPGIIDHWSRVDTQTAYASYYRSHTVSLSSGPAREAYHPAALRDVVAVLDPAPPPHGTQTPEGSASPRIFTAEGFSPEWPTVVAEIMLFVATIGFVEVMSVAV